MSILTLFILIVVFSVIIIEIRFFWQQKRTCQKYPFFGLRDEIAMEIAASEDYDKYMKIYEIVNRSISRLSSFNFTFYSEMMTSVITDILERAYANDTQISKPSKFSSEIWKQSKDVELPIFEKRLLDLILNTAKENSLLLRISMSKLCYRVFFSAYAFKGFKRFFKKHPELFKNHRDHIRTASDYSQVNHLIDGMHLCHQ